MGAVKTMGTTLVKKKSGSEAEDLVIADISVLGEFGIESEEIDVTTLDSPDGYRETIGSLKDAGEITFEGIIKSADNMEALIDLAESQSKEEWVITFPDYSSATFNAWVKMFKDTGAEVEGVRGFTGTLRLTDGGVDFEGAPISA